ncbi:MAG: hypothetical protein ACTSX6_07030 [Candidatus Heimdallarchaeaceae archaeon]
MVSMSKNEIIMYKELLELLEEKFSKNEIDEKNYHELKEKYEEKLRFLVQNEKLMSTTSNISTVGIYSISEDTLTATGSTKVKGEQSKKNIIIAGYAKFTNDIQCMKLHVAGSVKSYGNIETFDSVKIAGSFKCRGFLHSEKDVKFSGSAKIVGETIIKGRLVSAGSFKCLEDVQATNGINCAGSIHVEGNLLSQGTIDIEGKARILGNAIGEDIFINKKSFRFRRKKFKKSVIEGIVFAQNSIILNNTIVESDVKGVDVTIGPHSEVLGRVYYVDSVEISDKAKLSFKPIQITYESLKL